MFYHSKGNCITKYLTFVGIFPFFIGFTPGAVTSSDVRAEFESQKSFSTDKKGITDALYEIAQVLRNNREHTNLYEKVAILEASLTLSLERSSVLETRIKELEGKIPGIDNKLEASNRVLEKTAALEMSTRNLMENFEEKLSTLAAEILRLKSVASRESNSPLRSSLNSADTGSDSEHTREVVIKEICPSWHYSKCLYTFEDKVTNWTLAHKECQRSGGQLASSSDVTSLKLPKGVFKTFWVSESLNKNTSEKQEKYNEFHEELKANPPISDLHYEGPKENGNIDLPQIDALFREKNSTASRIIDIHHLPDSGEMDGNIEKTVYVSNIRSNTRDKLIDVASLYPDSGGGSIGRKTVKRSVDESLSLSPPEDAVLFNDFLLLQPERNNGEEDNAVISDSGGMRVPMSDSSSNSAPHDTLSFLKNMSKPKGDKQLTAPNKEKCPLLLCKEKTECQILWKLCSDENAFLCKRKG